MPEVSKYAPGTPSWVDLASPDLEASKRFYTGLFGWQAQTDPNPEAGGYTMFTLRGKNVAGGGPTRPGQPPAWSTYITVEDADATAAKVEAAGGTTLMAPFDVLEVGRMGVFLDPEGAAISVWQPRAHPGAELVNEPGTLCWNELLVRNPERVQPFYERVFGWRGDTVTEPMRYTQWILGDTGVAGMMPMPDEMPKDVPSHWQVYFAVADCVATVEKAKSLGATIVVPPSQIPPGTFSLIADTQGAVFNVLQFSA